MPDAKAIKKPALAGPSITAAAVTVARTAGTYWPTWKGISSLMAANKLEDISSRDTISLTGDLSQAVTLNEEDEQKEAEQKVEQKRREAEKEKEEKMKEEARQKEAYEVEARLNSRSRRREEVIRGICVGVGVVLGIVGRATLEKRD